MTHDAKAMKHGPERIPCSGPQEFPFCPFGCGCDNDTCCNEKGCGCAS